jgi:thioredoxin
MPSTIELDDDAFADRIARAATPVLAVFTATWCGPCKRFAPVVERVAEALEGSLLVATLDIDRAPATAARFGVRGAPTVLLFCDGELAARSTGSMPEHALRELVATCCAPRCTPSAAGR